MVTHVSIVSPGYRRAKCTENFEKNTVFHAVPNPIPKLVFDIDIMFIMELRVSVCFASSTFPKAIDSFYRYRYRCIDSISIQRSESEFRTCSVWLHFSEEVNFERAVSGFTSVKKWISNVQCLAPQNCLITFHLFYKGGPGEHSDHVTNSIMVSANLAATVEWTCWKRAENMLVDKIIV